MVHLRSKIGQRITNPPILCSGIRSPKAMKAPVMQSPFCKVSPLYMGKSTQDHGNSRQRRSAQTLPQVSSSGEPSKPKQQHKGAFFPNPGIQKNFKINWLASAQILGFLCWSDLKCLQKEILAGEMLRVWNLKSRTHTVQGANQLHSCPDSHTCAGWSHKTQTTNKQANKQINPRKCHITEKQILRNILLLNAGMTESSLMYKRTVLKQFAKKYS